MNELHVTTPRGVTINIRLITRVRLFESIEDINIIEESQIIKKGYIDRDERCNENTR